MPPIFHAEFVGDGGIVQQSIQLILQMDNLKVGCWRHGESDLLSVRDTNTAVGAPDGDDGWARGRVATIRPVGGWLCKGRVVGLTRVLNVDHHTFIGDDRATGFRASGNGEEALEFTSIVAFGGYSVKTIVGTESISVGRNPHQSVRSEERRVGQEGIATCAAALREPY